VPASALGLLSTYLADTGERRDRLRRVAKRLLWYASGVSGVIGAFVLIYVVAGRGRQLASALHWTLLVGAGALDGTRGAYPINQESFAAWSLLARPYAWWFDLGTTFLDFVMGPALGILGLIHALVALLRSRWSRSTSAIFGLSCLSFFVQRHVFLTPDNYHIANATAPGVVLLAALAEQASALRLRTRRAAAIPLGYALSLFASVFWLYHGGAAPIGIRLARIASGQEHPAFGKPHDNPSLPRAGDVFVPADDTRIVQYIRAHTTRRDRVLATTSMIGGGLYSFLAERENPTPFDTAQESASPIQARIVLEALHRHPPTIIVGSYFAPYGPQVQRYIADNWVAASVPSSVELLVRR
jgi:hypothetical protein